MRAYAAILAQGIALEIPKLHRIWERLHPSALECRVVRRNANKIEWHLEEGQDDGMGIYGVCRGVSRRIKASARAGCPAPGPTYRFAGG